jgi:hypothetical protein
MLFFLPGKIPACADVGAASDDLQQKEETSLVSAGQYFYHMDKNRAGCSIRARCSEAI